MIEVYASAQIISILMKIGADIGLVNAYTVHKNDTYKTSLVLVNYIKRCMSLFFMFFIIIAVLSLMGLSKLSLILIYANILGLSLSILAGYGLQYLVLKKDMIFSLFYHVMPNALVLFLVLTLIATPKLIVLGPWLIVLIATLTSL